MHYTLWEKQSGGLCRSIPLGVPTAKLCIRDVFENRVRGKIPLLLKNEPASCFAMTRTLALFPPLLASEKSRVKLSF